MNIKNLLAVCVLSVLGISNLTAQGIVPSGSVSPAAVGWGGVDQLTFTRNGTTPEGFGWTEATLWNPSGSPSYDVLGNNYTIPTSQTFAIPYNGVAVGGPANGIYWIQYRLVDANYNYQDQWIEINANLVVEGDMIDQRAQHVDQIEIDVYSADSSLTSASYYYTNPGGTTIGPISLSGSSSHMTRTDNWANYDNGLTQQFSDGTKFTVVTVDSSGTHTQTYIVDGFITYTNEGGTSWPFYF